MNEDFEKIQSKNNELRYSVVFNEAWALYTKLIGVGALVVMLYVASSILVSYFVETSTGFGALSNAFMAEIQGMTNLNSVLQEVQDFYKENLSLAVITRLTTDFILLLAFPLAGGFMFVCREMETKGVAALGTVFSGFKPEYWGRLMLLALLYFFISKIAFLFFFLPGIYVWVGAVIACPLIMFTNQSAWSAFKNSFNLVNKNWIAVFQLLFVATLIGLAGYLLCFAGRIISYPFVLVMVYMLYKHLVGFETEQDSK